MRIKEQETRLTLQEHDDDDDDESFISLIFHNIFSGYGGPPVLVYNIAGQDMAILPNTFRKTI